MITQYEQVCNTFLNASGVELERMRKKVKAVINTTSPNKKPYKIDHKKAVKDYRKLAHDGCIDEFLTNYCWGFFMCNPSIDSPINREAYFLELKGFFRELVSQGVLASDC